MKKYYLCNSNNLDGGKLCPDGQILRKKYKTNKGTIVSSKCIKDRGQPGKGPNILPPVDTEIHFSKFGYKTTNSAPTRQKALSSIVNYYKKNKNLPERKAALKVLRRVVLLRTYNKSNEKIKNIMSKDVKYLQHKYFPDL
jgi:hypothetical protein